MTVVILGENAQVQALIAQRRALGQDGHDEVWEGIYHVAPHAALGHGEVEIELALALSPHAKAAGLKVTGAFNLGEPTNFRVPDLGVRVPGARGVYLATAAMVVEVLSPDDETFAKFDFYADHGVDEILVADPDSRSIRCWSLAARPARPLAVSAVLGVACADLEAQLDWPESAAPES